MKKVLLVSYFFAPDNTIGAIRPTKIAKYLSSDIITVDVICAKKELRKDETIMKDIDNINKISYVEHSKIFKRFFVKDTINQNTKLIKREEDKTKECVKFVNFIKKTKSRLLRSIVSNIKDIDFYLSTKHEIKRSSIDIGEYDIILTTFGPLSSHLIGLWIKRKYKKIKWIADFRDPMMSEFIPVVIKPLIKIIQCKICKNCDVITAVSQGYLEIICGTKYLIKGKVITNGYDLDDLSEIKGIKEKKDKLTFVYTGATYEGKRDIYPLLKVLSELIEEKKILPESFEFHYAGNDIKYIIQQSKKLKLENRIINHGLLHRKDALSLQSKCDILVVTTWNTEKSYGVLPGKLYEYMQFKKPIIALVSGEKPNSEIVKIIKKCNIGFGYEESCKKEDLFKLKQFILSQYESLTKFKKNEFQVNEIEVKKYDYKILVEKFYSIF